MVELRSLRRPARFAVAMPRRSSNGCARLQAERPRFGWRRINVLLQREGTMLNHKRLRRFTEPSSWRSTLARSAAFRYARGSTIVMATRPNRRPTLVGRLSPRYACQWLADPGYDALRRRSNLRIDQRGKGSATFDRPFASVIHRGLTASPQSTGLLQSYIAYVRGGATVTDNFALTAVE